MPYQHIDIPSDGEKISVNEDFSLNVPNNPIIPYIRGDGTGIDITPVMRMVVDAAVEKAYSGKRRISWMEIFAGERAVEEYGNETWLPDETLDAIRDYVIATMNLNGDYISDALAAQVGGIGIAPGANISDTTALFEATHGTAPKYAGKDQVNPGSLILSAEMMLRHMGWKEAADLIVKGMSGAIQAKTVTYDFARLMDGAEKVSCSGFGEAVIRHM